MIAVRGYWVPLTGATMITYSQRTQEYTYPKKIYAQITLILVDLFDLKPHSKDGLDQVLASSC